MKRIWNYKATTILFVILIFLLIFTGCKKEDEEVESEEAVNSPTLSMGLPDSLTGGKKSTSIQRQTSAVSAMNSIIINQASAGSNDPCALNDSSSDDPFVNGYETTKFFVRIADVWSCIADQFIAIGQWESAFNDQYFIISDANFSGVKLTKNSGTRKSIRIYYNGPDSDPGWYFTWETLATGITGKLVIVAANTDSTDDLKNLRIDFNQTLDLKSTEFFIEYKATQTNELNGFRAIISKNLNVDELNEKRIVAQGLLDFAGQPLSTSSALPNTFQYKVYTISDEEGKGGARANIVDVGVDISTDSAYIFSRDDWFLFTTEGASEYINKNATIATWIDGPTGLAGCTLNDASAPCAADFNTWFSDGNVSWEQNSGSTPANDPRYDYLLTVEDGSVDGPTYLTTVYPNGSDWATGFEMTP